MKRTRAALEFLQAYRTTAPDEGFTQAFDSAVRAELARLMEYSIHHYWCPGTMDTDERCTCGFRELRRYVNGGDGTQTRRDTEG